MLSKKIFARILAWLCMTIAIRVIAMESAKQTMTDFFNIKNKIITKGLFSLFLPKNQPWHYIENIINEGSLALCCRDKILLSANSREVIFFSFDKKKIIKRQPCNAYDACFDSVGNQYAVVNDGKVTIFDVIMSEKKGKTSVAMKSKASVEIDRTATVMSLCFNNDGTKLYIPFNFGDICYVHAIRNNVKRKQWGYDGSIQSLSCSPVNTNYAIYSDDYEIIIYDTNQSIINKNREIHQHDVSFFCFNNDGTRLAAGLYEEGVRLFDVDSSQLLWSLYFKECISALCFDSLSKRIVIGSNPQCKDPCIRIIAQYNDYTPDQCMLRKIINLWLQVKKHSQQLNTASLVLSNIAQLLCLDDEELNYVWETFPEYMRCAIERTIIKRIMQYGIPLERKSSKKDLFKRAVSGKLSCK